MRLMSNLSGPQTVSSIVCSKGVLGSWDRGGAGRFRDPKERKDPLSEYQAFASDVLWICRWAKKTPCGPGEKGILTSCPIARKLASCNPLYALPIYWARGTEGEPSSTAGCVLSDRMLSD